MISTLPFGTATGGGVPERISKSFSGDPHVSDPIRSGMPAKPRISLAGYIDVFLPPEAGARIASQRSIVYLNAPRLMVTPRRFSTDAMSWIAIASWTSRGNSITLAQVA